MTPSGLCEEGGQGQGRGLTSDDQRSPQITVPKRKIFFTPIPIKPKYYVKYSIHRFLFCTPENTHPSVLLHPGVYSTSQTARLAN